MEKAAEAERDRARAEERCAERERAISELQTLLASMDGSRGDVETQLRCGWRNDVLLLLLSL